MEPEEILHRIKEYARLSRKPRTDGSYAPPQPDDFVPSETILCFDQTLSNCGWAVLSTETPDGRPVVRDCGVVRPPAFERGEKGFEATFVKSVFIARELRKLLDRSGYGSYRVVAELPAVQGYRTESSLVAAVTLVQALDERGSDIPVFVSRQQAAAVLCGDRSAPKAMSKALVNDLIGDRHPSGLPWNEHVHDAVFIGLRYLHKGQV